MSKVRANGTEKNSSFFSGFGRKKKDKPQYDGEWKNGKANGKGSCTWPNGDTYSGDWKDNRMHGRGVFVWKLKSCRYDGEYRNGLSHGEGTLTLQDEGEYKGEFFEGKKHGKGRWMGPDDMCYEGQYHQDKRHGYGILNMQDGSSYEGQWKDGRFDGDGVWTWRDGRSFEGRFSEDHPVGGILKHEGASRPVKWHPKTGTFVSADHPDESVSPRRWSGGVVGRSIAADAATPPAAGGMLWGLCTSSRKVEMPPNSARTHKTNNTFDDDDMPPLPVKETWCPPSSMHTSSWSDHRRRLCAWAGLV